MRAAALTLFLPLLVVDASAFANEPHRDVVLGGIQVGQRLVRIVSQGKDTFPSTCSGVVLDAERGYVVTAHHCVDQENVNVVVDGKHATVTRENRVLDLAVLHTQIKEKVNATLAPENPTLASDVWVVGYALATEHVAVQRGIVSYYDPDNMRIDPTVLGGDSGGAVFDSKGQLVAIVSSVSAWPSLLQPLGVVGNVVPVETVRDFVRPYLPPTTAVLVKK